jgi:D-tyrosyl-tRNA(Tyr) deacylase
VGAIGHGLLVFVGIHSRDTPKEADWLVRKITTLRIFDDEDGRMNLSLADVRGSILVVSQFTLYGDIRKGNRPSFAAAAAPEPARLLYQYFLERCREVPELMVEAGIFQAAMMVDLVNDGPVTIWCDTESIKGLGAAGQD